MKTVGFIASKGGVGKSTLAAHIAVAAARDGKKVSCIDLDPQGSLAAWGERRTADDVQVVSARVQELGRLLDEARTMKTQVLVIDTAGRDDIVAGRVAQVSDVVLVPVRPGVYDLEASAITARTLKASKAKARFVLNSCQSTGTRAKESAAQLSELLEVCPIQVGTRVDFADALIDGRSVFELNSRGKAALEVSQLYKWVMKHA